MTELFLERTFDPGLSVDDVCAMAVKNGWCYTMYGVEWRGSFLAAGGGRMVCWFKAPDAESARQALRRAGADMTRLWIGTAHEGPKPVAPNVLVERSFGEPTSLDAIQAIEDAGVSCLETHRVEFAQTFFSADRTRMLCLYRAPDAEAVRVAQREAGMPLETAWSFDRIGLETLAARGIDPTARR
jgi:hypothetical protein